MKISFYTLMAVVLFVFGMTIRTGAQTNLALGKPVLSSSNFDATAFPNSNLTDGNFSTFAHTNNAQGPPLGEWFQIDLGADYFIDRVTIGCRPGAPNRLRRFLLITWPSAVGGSQGDNPNSYPSQARYNRLLYTDPGPINGTNYFGTTAGNPSLPGYAGQNLGPAFPSNVLNLNVGQHKARYILLLNLQDDYLDPTELQVFAGPPPVRAITNGGFETGTTTMANGFPAEANVPGWSTTEMNGVQPGTGNTIPADGGLLEFWRSGFLGVPSFEGNYFVELNAYTNGMVVQQPICVLPGETFNFSFAHRGRDGVDVMGLSIDDIEVARFSDNNAQAGTHSVSVLQPATTAVSATHPTNAAGWTQYSGTWTNTSGVSKVVTFGYSAVSSATGLLGSGNFLDAVTITSLSTMVTLNQATSTGPESIATDNLPKLYITGQLATAGSVELNITGGTAVRDSDYITPGFSGPITIHIPAGFYDGTDATAIDLAPYIQIVSDLVPAEPDETILMTIQNPSSTALQLADANSCGTAILSNTYTITDAPAITIGGHVLNDLNGLTDNTVNGSGTNAGGLNALLVNNHNVIAVSSVDAAGAFLFTDIASGQPYTVLITPATATAGDPEPGVSLPAGWISTGENNSATAGDDGLINGISASFTPATNTTDINFGIQEPPTATADNSDDNTLGQAVTVLPLANDNDPSGGTLDPATVSLITPPGIPTVTEANGDVVEVTVADEGTWTADPATGAITFTPLPGFVHDPTPIAYIVADNAGSYAPPAIVTITYAGALPVGMLRFDAILSGVDVILQWATSQEQNSSHFEIEYSTDGIHFKKAGEQPAAGNSTSPRDYTFTHAGAGLLHSSVLYYRLRQLDLDGAATYSKVAIVYLSEASGKIQIYPNPVAMGRPVTITAQNIQEIQLYTPVGKLIWSGHFNNSSMAELPTTRLKAGFYLLRVNGRQSGKIIITE